MVDLDDDGRSVIWEKSWPKARKEYRCGECDSVIAIGEKHEKHSSLFDGAWSNHRMCYPCSYAADWLMDECGGFIYGSVYIDIKDHLEDGEVRPADVVAKLTEFAEGMEARKLASRAAST